MAKDKTVKKKSVKTEDPKVRKTKESKPVTLDVTSMFNDTLDVIERRQGMDSSSLDVAPPMSTGLLQVDMVMGGGIRASMITAAGGEQCAKTTFALQVMAEAIKQEIPFIAFKDFEGCFTADTKIGYGKGKHKALRRLFDLSDVDNWEPGTWVGQYRTDIDTVETGHTKRGTGVRSGELFYKGKKPTTRVTLNTGHTFVGYRHKMFVLRGNQVYERSLENLQVGEHVLIDSRFRQPPEEVWVPVSGYGAEIAKKYEVSNYGVVRSRSFVLEGMRKSKLGNSHPYSKVIKGKLLKPFTTKEGYVTVNFCTGGGKGTPTLLHRVVAFSFLGIPSDTSCVLHWNDNPSDNCVWNLRFGSDLDNSRDKVVRGRAPVGEEATKAKLTQEQIAEIKILRESGLTLQVIADRYNVTPSTVFNACAGNSWKYTLTDAYCGVDLEAILEHFTLAAVTSVEATGKKQHVFDISLKGVADDEIPHALITNGIVTHNSTKNSKTYVQSILKGSGVKMTVDEVFGKRDKVTGKWITPPRVRYSAENILERFYDWLSEILRELPDKRYVAGKWWLVFDEKNKKHVAKVAQFADKDMARKYGGLWVPAQNDKIQGLVFIDSYTAMNPQAKDEEAISNQLSVKASAFSKQIERVKGRMADKMVAVYGLNHLRANPMAMFGPKEEEKGGIALRQFSDVRLRQTSRSLSGPKAYFSPKPGKKGGKPTFNEIEASVEFPGTKDEYRYVHVKAIKNKLWTPNREGWMRIWIEDGNGKARGIDPVFDTMAYLKDTGQVTGTRERLKLDLKDLGKSKRPMTWAELKLWILGKKEDMVKISTAAGFKPMNLRSFCFKQMRSEVAEDLWVAQRAGKDSAGGKDDEDDEAEE